MEEKVKFGFGLDQEHCETDMFDSIEELLEYAQASWDEKDGNPFDEDCDDCGSIFVGTIKSHTPYDFAPSLDDIADQMTDSFYNDLNVDDNGDVQICHKEEAEKLWKEFVDKYFDIPCSCSTQWFGEYDLVEHKWIDKYAHFDKYVK